MSADINKQFQIDSKKRGRDQLAAMGNDEKIMLSKMMDPKQFNTIDDHTAFNIEALYKAHELIEGFNVHVELVKSAHELEVELLKLNPSQVLITEPNLEFLRVIEVFEATRAKT